jgi:hypothetical protein
MRAIQYSEESVMESKGRSVLDTPLSRSMTAVGGAARQCGQSAACPPTTREIAQENVALTVPSPDNSITTLSPAVSQMVLTRLPVSTISPARRPLPSEAR